MENEMPIKADGNAPYAPTAGVLSLIDRARQRGLPNPVTKDVLLRSGISDSLAPRTLQALQLLELINDDGTWTSNLEMLRKAPEAEFSARFAELIRSVYADLFQYVDPSKSQLTEIRDAFRSYLPHGQQDRMVSLFVGLCQRAGLAPDGVVKAAPREPRSTPKVVALRRKPTLVSAPTSSMQPSSGLPAPLAGLLATLPKDGWTKQERDRFEKAFSAMLDYSIPVREKAADPEEEPE
jgi:hypothetical protein